MTDAESETPVLWPPDVKNWLIREDPDAGKDWRQEEKGLTEDEMVRWHHWLSGREFEQALAIGDRQGSLAWWNPWGCKELDTTERLNWTELNWIIWEAESQDEGVGEGWCLAMPLLLELQMAADSVSSHSFSSALS